MRVLVLNDYALRSGLDRHRRGDYPGHLLHGVAQLAGRFHIGLLPEDGWMARLPRRPAVRNLATQLQGLGQAGHYDVILSCAGYETILLGVVRRVLRRRRPGLAAIVHRPPPRGLAGRLLRFAYAAHDALVCISPLAYADLAAADLSPAAVRRVDWGVDLDFYRPAPLPDDPPLRVLSVGKTKRDYDVLVRAMTGQAAHLTVYCDAASRPDLDIPPNVTLHVAPPGGESVPYATLLEEYARSQVVAVPLHESDDLNGISSVFEAMASGRGVLCTKTRGAAIDPEARGFGRCLAPGDVEAWRQAIADLADDRVALVSWGARAREVAESAYDLDRFAAEVISSLEAAAR